MPQEAFTVEPTGANDTGVCNCCGNRTRIVWGNINCSSRIAAVYYVKWTLCHVEKNGANFDLILGRWGEGASSRDRRVVAVRYRLIEGNPVFMVIDAAGRLAAVNGKLAAVALRREEVIGTPLASEVFAMLDAIWLRDDRIAELR
jgi:hypothetical protein